ncbi:DUF4307 domain-containing protein [Leucobacter sp. UCMA 4100]|uniref:DUF4307 domain-containing protein n=1 Tax=Leucobacter TaxID=55968 RepID=UPI001C23565C|nr:DUF4307 domain-containing protein [Leucobacter sp. UCMA 4100]MDA3147689.1 DUF4307 domain-containing protein [Leucobacter sp. UCMA 4100]
MVHNAPPQVSDRYGKTRKKRLDLWIGGVFAGVLVLAGIAFLAFGGLPTSDTSIEFRDIAHTLDDSDTKASLTFEVTAPVQHEVVCQVEALNPSYAVVGSQLVELPRSDERTRIMVQEVRTHNRPTTITVKDCWIQPNDER